MRIIIFFILIAFNSSSVAWAQHRRGSSSHGSTFKGKKQAYKYEFIGCLGATNFLGDLGGANQIGTNGLRDLELQLTRPAMGLGFRFKIQEFISIKSNLYFGILTGDDRLTSEPFRRNRNLSFKSPLLELSSQVEANLMKERKGHVYKIRGLRGSKHKEFQLFVFAGFGGLYFNPRGLYNGQWYELQPLGTEGQGIIPGTKKYSRITGALFTGGGVRIPLNRYWGIGMEWGIRKTFSDYIDDVSTVYHTQLIKANGGSTQAIYFADPSQGKGAHPESVADGLQRGGPSYKDAYIFGMFTIGYKVMYKKRSRAKF